MRDCLFCKIAAGEIESYTIYEDDDTRAFLDVHPLTLGHTVVVPKKHFSTVIDLPDNLLSPLLGAVRGSTALLADKLGAENFSIGINHGRMLGHPDIDHLHIHVVPRYEGDGGGDFHSIVKFPPKEDLRETHKKITT